MEDGMEDPKQQKYLTNFANNLKEGIAYYAALIPDEKQFFKENGTKLLQDLDNSKAVLQTLLLQYGISGMV
jgi:hypothetical protein